MTLRALRQKPKFYTLWQKLMMTCGCLIILFIGYPVAHFAIYLFSQKTFFGIVFGLILGFLGVVLMLWCLMMVFRVWASRWPFRAVGETVL